MDPLYHYCSATAFHSIVTSSTVRLSSLRQSNDASEGRMVAQAMARMAERDGLSGELKDNLQSAILNLEDLWEGLGICLSDEGDLLNQWRAYADNGSGVSIGFDRKYIDWLAESSRGSDVDIELVRVEYRPLEHEKLVEPTYRKLLELFKSEEPFPPGVSDELQNSEDPKVVSLRGRIALLTLLEASMDSLGEVFSLKHPAFEEERESRLLHFHGVSPEMPSDYRAVSGAIVPYKSCQLRGWAGPRIAEVVLGPRHTTPVSVLTAFLSQFGFANVEIKKSVAPYR